MRIRTSEKLSSIVSILLLFSLLNLTHPLNSSADDGRTGEDLSSLLFSSRDLLKDFDMTKAGRMCGAEEALNAVHSLFKTRATTFAGDSKDPSETRVWRSLSGTSTSIVIDWGTYTKKYSGGSIYVRSTIKNECAGKSSRDLKFGSVRFSIPVRIDSKGNFRAGKPKNIHIDTICCGSQRITRTALFTPGGKIIRAEGTIYPPAKPKPKPKPKPTVQPGGSSGGVSSSPQPVTPRPTPPKPKPPKPKPKPEPWTEKNPCPECEDEKAMVDHQKQRLAKFEKEKVKQEKELKKVKGKIEQLDKSIRRIEKRLKTKKNVGAESTDPTTGIRTTSYDQGDGTVVVKRIYPNGREETIDTYTRRSAKDLKRDLDGKKKKRDRLKNDEKRVEKRIKALENAIKQAKDDLAKSRAAFLACLEYCNRLIGIPPATSPPLASEPGAVSMPGSNNETSPGQKGGKESVDQPSQDEPSAETQDSSQTTSEETGSEVPSSTSDSLGLGGGTYGTSGTYGTYGLDWNVKYNWSSGFTYFDEKGSIGYDYTVEPAKNTQGGTGGTIEGDNYSFGSSASDPPLKIGYGVKYRLDEQYDLSGIRYDYSTDKLPQSATSPQSQISPQTTPQTTLQTGTGSLLGYQPSPINRAISLIECGAPASAIGNYIGTMFRGKNTFVPGWYAAALETFALLDDYDFYEEEIFPREYGEAVASAVLAAGGTPRDAAIMGGRAAARVGGSLEDVKASMLSAYLPPKDYGFGADGASSWNDASWARPGFFPCPPLRLRIDPTIIQREPPVKYHIMQHQFKYQFNDTFNSGLRNNLDDIKYTPPASDIPSDTWSLIPPRINLTYDITGDGKNVVKLSPSKSNWTIGSDYLNGDLGIDVNPNNYPIQHVPTGLFVPSVTENNLTRDPQETRVVPNDPLYGVKTESSVGKFAKKGFGLLLGVVGVETNDWPADYQWGLHAIGLTPKGENSGWDIYDGSEPNVIVAVIDSGIDLNHPDGPEFNWINEKEIPENNIDDDGNGYIDDIHGWNFITENNNVQDDFGHGAFVAGIIAAKSNNSIGIAGVNPGARIMTLKASKGNGTSKSLDIYRAIRYAVDNGAKVINISLGKKGLSELEQIGINYAWNMGCLVVVAAGNQGNIVSKYGPPGSPRAFSVASINVDGSRRSASNKGKTIALSAPGESIYSLSSSTGKRNGTIMPISKTEYHRLDGTSFAAPYVSGAASLLWAKYPELTNRQIANLLIATAQDKESPGWDILTGAGMVNVKNALEQAENGIPGLRITDLVMIKPGGSLHAADLYGVVDGSVSEYSVLLAQGYDPDEDDYKEVCGPAEVHVDHNLICRIDKEQLKGSKWTFKLRGILKDGSSKSVSMAFDKTGQAKK